MPLEAPLAPVIERVAALNARYAHHSAADVLAHALDDPQVGNSRFGFVVWRGIGGAVAHGFGHRSHDAGAVSGHRNAVSRKRWTISARWRDRLGLTGVQTIRPDRDRDLSERPQ